jgi:hypothetical protein
MSTTTSLVTLAKNFDIGAVTYGNPKTNNHGGKSIPILVNGQKLVLQFPFTFTWGAQTNVDEASGRTTYSLNLVLDEGSPLRTALAALQEKVMEDSVANSRAWYGKSIASREVVDALFYPVVRFPKNKDTGEPDTDRNPSVKAKLAAWEGVVKTELYNMERELIHDARSLVLDVDEVLASIPQASHLTGLLQCDGIWYAGGRCGVTWRLLQAKVKPPVRLEGYCLVDDSDEEDDASAIDAAAAAAAAGQDAPTSPTPQSEATTPPPAPKKKRQVKQKTTAASAGN